MTSTIDWQARVGDVWAQEWRRTDRSLADLGRHLDAAILATAPSRTFTALDIGCGAGATAIALAKTRPDATVVGVDLSAALLAVARERSHGLANSRWRQGDAVEAASLIAPDLLVSRHGVMFFADPLAAFTALRRAAAPGAKLVFSCFAAVVDNPWATLITAPPPVATSYVPGPFAFADPDYVRGLLARAGWNATP